MYRAKTALHPSIVPSRRMVTRPAIIGIDVILRVRWGAGSGDSEELETVCTLATMGKQAPSFVLLPNDRNLLISAHMFSFDASLLRESEGIKISTGLWMSSSV